MTTEELEQLLAISKKQDEKERSQQMLQSAANFVGKCFSSHLFQRLPKANKQIYLRKIEDVKIDSNGKIAYLYTQITFTGHGDTFKINVDKGSSDQPFPTWICSWSNEIESNLFEHIKNEVIAHGETYFDVISKLFKQTSLTTNGQMNKYNAQFYLLEKAGYSFIELPQDVFQLLSCYEHPFLYNEKILNTEQSIQIIKFIADDIIKNAQSWGGSILNRDRPRYETLIKFYNTYNHNG